MATTDTDLNRDADAARYANAEAERGRDRYLDGADDREPQAIERDIDATRADMRATLETLERRFSTDRLIDMTIGRIRERGGEFAANLTEAATQNPMPLLLTSIGLAWMMLGSGRRARLYEDANASPPRRSRMGAAADKIRGAADSTRETLQEAADASREAWRSAGESSRGSYDRAADSLRHTTDSLRSGATRAASATREHVQQARAGMDRMLEEQPLMLGVLGLAAGAIIGSFLPATEQENRLLGDVRDKTLKQVARESRARFEAAREHAAMAVDAAVGGDEDRPTSRPH